MSNFTAQQRRQFRGLITMGFFLLFAAYAFFFNSDKTESITFGFIVGNEWAFLKEWVVASKTGAGIFILLSIFGLFIGYLEFKSKRTLTFSSFIFGSGFIMSFLCWAASGKFIPFTGLLQGALMLSVPLIFGSMSGLLCEKSGVINIAIEGQLLAAAFVSGIIASLTQSSIWGLVAAPFAGALISLFLAIFAIKYAVDQVIIGFVINVLVIGFTGFIYTELLIPYEDKWNSGPSFSSIEIPLLSKIPIIGPVLFNQTIIVYFMYIIIIAVQVALFRTKWGLRTRAVGEMPIAADSVGVNVNRLRFWMVLWQELVAHISLSVQLGVSPNR
jgi:simple sugar transport system permease protein